MEIKKEALELADFIEKHMVEFGLILGQVSRNHIVETIRKLVIELEKEKAKSVNSANSDFNNCFTKTANEILPQKPLNDADICWLWVMCEKDGTQATYVNFARAIEERHGIK